MIKTIYIAITLFFSSICYSLTFPIQKNSDIVGFVQTVTVQKGETLFNISRRFDLGLLEVMEANPNINPKKLKAGQKLKLPTAFILPPGPRDGIVLNLAELRIYHYRDDNGEKVVETYPVGIGRSGWLTPIGDTSVIRKKDGPTWRPPKSIRNHYLKKGKTLPDSIGPGPDNPLGEYALYLGIPRILIHGTNQPTSIGIRSSSGCIRMYPEDIKSLFHTVKKGTKVRILHEPYKIGKHNNMLFIEAHEPFPENYYGHSDNEDELEDAISNITSKWKIDWDQALFETKSTIGYPVEISSFNYR